MLPITTPLGFTLASPRAAERRGSHVALAHAGGTAGFPWPLPLAAVLWSVIEQGAGVAFRGFPDYERTIEAIVAGAEIADFGEPALRQVYQETTLEVEALGRARHSIGARGEPGSHRARQGGVLFCLRDGGHRRQVVIREPVAGMHLQAQAGGTARGAVQAL